MFDFILRDMVEEDKPFIYNSFINSYYQTTPIKYIVKDLYCIKQTKVIDSLLDKSNILIACFPEEPDQIIGYIIYESHQNHLVLHYLYIKDLFRNKSIGQNIINQVKDKDIKLIMVTHITDQFYYLKHKVKNTYIKYNPYLLETHE